MKNPFIKLTIKLIIVAIFFLAMTYVFKPNSSLLTNWAGYLGVSLVFISETLWKVCKKNR